MTGRRPSWGKTRHVRRRTLPGMTQNPVTPEPTEPTVETTEVPVETPHVDVGTVEVETDNL